MAGQKQIEFRPVRIIPRPILSAKLSSVTETHMRIYYSTSPTRLRAGRGHIPHPVPPLIVLHRHPHPPAGAQPGPEAQPRPQAHTHIHLC